MSNTSSFLPGRGSLRISILYSFTLLSIFARYSSLKNRSNTSRWVLLLRQRKLKSHSWVTRDDPCTKEYQKRWHLFSIAISSSSMSKSLTTSGRSSGAFITSCCQRNKQLCARTGNKQKYTLTARLQHWSVALCYVRRWNRKHVFLHDNSTLVAAAPRRHYTSHQPSPAQHSLVLTDQFLLRAAHHDHFGARLQLQLSQRDVVCRRLAFNARVSQVFRNSDQILHEFCPNFVPSRIWGR